MAKRAEAPSRSSAVEELEDALDGDQDGTESAEDTTGATPREGSEASTDAADQVEDPDGEGAGGEGSQDTDLEGIDPTAGAVAAWEPPEGGTPFRFQADHREVEVPGALEWDHGIYVPKDAWNGVVSRHLADREGLQAYYQGQIGDLQRLVIERDPENNPRVIQADVTIKKFLELFDSGPEAVAKWLDNYAQNRPLLEAQIQLESKDRELQARNQQVSEADWTTAVQTTREALPGYLEQTIAALVTQVPELAALKGSEKKLVEQLWPYARSIFTEADQDYPQYGVSKGQIVPVREVLENLLKQEASRRAELKALQKAGKHNRAATGKATPTKTVSTRGRPVPAGQRKEYKPGDYREAKDDYLSADLTAD